MQNDFEEVWRATSPARVTGHVNFKDPREGAVSTNTSDYPIFKGSTWGCWVKKMPPNLQSVRGPVPTSQPTLGVVTTSLKESNQVSAELSTFPKATFIASQEWEVSEQKPEQPPKPKYQYKRSSQPSSNWRRSWPYRPVVHLHEIFCAYTRLFPGLKVLSYTQFSQLKKQIPTWGLENSKTDFKRHKRICRQFLDMLIMAEPARPQSHIPSTFGLGWGITVGPWPPINLHAHSPNFSEEDTDPFEDAVEHIE